MYLKEIGYENVKQLELGEGHAQWQTLVLAMSKHWVL
jgi:hypothetical protein